MGVLFASFARLDERTRFYEQALQLYQRGSALDPRSADAAYNA